MTRQPWWSPKHRSSSPDNGVDALTELTRLHLGSLHATACEVAHIRRTRSSGNSVPWVTPHTSLELPGRAARSRGRTSTGEFQSIHGILSSTFLDSRFHGNDGLVVISDAVYRPSGSTTPLFS